jgi:4-hydroxybenzoate polyprenyltransferase
LRLSTPELASPAPPPQVSLGSLPRAILRELRPKQWLKNGLVFLGLVYALRFTDLDLILRSVIAFLAFCAISSAGYIFNDIRDLELDKHHPTKRFRPIASGRLPVGLAWAIAILLGMGGFGLAFILGVPFALTCVAYVFITASYSLWWKHLVLLDVFAISAGFVIRAVAGAVAVAVPISPWLYVCTILGSLIIALSKRRSEIQDSDIEDAGAHRPALEHYTVTFLDHLIVITATASVMAYSLYTFSAENVPKNHIMMVTIPIVLYGVFRYLFLVQIKGLGGAPEELLLGDRSLATAVILFLVLSAGLLFFGTRIG